MKISEIIDYLEELAPPSLQESYDNSGLIVGSKNDEISKVLICLDSTEDVVDEAIAEGCNLIIAHHPIVFKGLKRFNGSNYVERVVMKAIKNDIAIYAIHTNLDNVLKDGVNSKIAEKLALSNSRVLVPMQGQIMKLTVYVPKANAELLRGALANAGAGQIGDYDSCSFESEGTGRFRASEDAKPYVGEVNKVHAEAEQKIELVFHASKRGAIVKTIKENHPYEEPAFDIIKTENIDFAIGSGLIAELESSMAMEDFLPYLKQKMGLEVIRYTNGFKNKIKNVAVCGGSGSFLLNAAKSAGADVFITGDFKYHEFFDGENHLNICDIGHYESEQYTIELLSEIINKKFPNFAVVFAETVSNPVNYYY